METDTQTRGFLWTDGGRARAGFATRNDAGDCFVRAAAIAMAARYAEVYESVSEMNAEMFGKRSARDGVSRKLARAWMDSQGWEWTPTMAIGSGCTVHLTPAELPDGRLVVSVSKHFTTMIHGVVWDNHDPRRDGTRCVYGYWTER